MIPLKVDATSDWRRVPRIPCIPCSRSQIKHSVLTLLIASALAASAAKPELLRVEGSVDAMGTGFSIVAYGEDRLGLQSAVAPALEMAPGLDPMRSNLQPC